MMLAKRRAKTTLPSLTPRVPDLIAAYEALPRLLPYSALAELFLHYLAAMSTCVRTRSGNFRPY